MRTKHGKARKRVPAGVQVADRLRDYWDDQVRQFGRKEIFIDTGAILESLQPDGDEVREFLESGLLGDRLITSTYVIAEAVRRMVKSRTNEFIGPDGERCGDLAQHFLQRWLQQHLVRVICVPDYVFEDAKASYARVRHHGCDLIDTLSYVIVSGLQQTRIVAKDEHFAALGLMRLP